MYAEGNPKTKAELKRRVAGAPVPCFQPGPFGPDVRDGIAVCEGPHFPEPHRWYARCEVKDGAIVRVLS